MSKTASERLKRALARQTRILSAKPTFSGEIQNEYLAIKNCLLAAQRDQVVVNSPYEIINLLKWTPNNSQHKGRSLIIGGEKDYNRTGRVKCIKRKDGAWFNFSFAFNCEPGRAVILDGYNLEFVCSGKPFIFLRFDLNYPRQPNQNIGMLSHVHPSSDDHLIPFPVLSPVELLEFVIYDLHDRRNVPRSTRGHSGTNGGILGAPKPNLP